MNQYHSYCDDSDDIDWASIITEMTTTIDSLKYKYNFIE